MPDKEEVIENNETQYMTTLTTNMGWQCPGCNKCYAPWVPKCEDCGTGFKFNYTPELTPMPECEHVWGVPRTNGTFCIRCGVQQIPPAPTGTICGM